MAVQFIKSARRGKPITWYVYAFKGGPLVMKKVQPKKPILSSEAHGRIAEAIKASNAPNPALLLSLIHDWRISPEWKRLAEGTRRTWGFQLDQIEVRWGDKPIGVWDDPRMVARVVKWRDERAATPRSADMGVTVLRELLKFGRLRGRVRINVAADIPHLYKGGDRAEIVWTENDIERFCVAALQLDCPQVIDVILLAEMTGLRRQDLVSLTWEQVGEFAIVKRALKRSAGKRRTTTMPCLPELSALLAELKTRFRKNGVDTVLVNSFGEAWTGDGVGGTFNRVRDQAGIVHIEEGDDGKRLERRKHLHDVRGTFVTRLCLETDLTDTEIANTMAWSVDRIATIRRVYVAHHSVVVHLAERIVEGRAKHAAKQSAAIGEN